MSLPLLLKDLLTAQADQIECSDLAAWLPLWREKQTEHWKNGPFVAAITAAAMADRFAWAFFSGYQGAMQITFRDRVRVGSVNAFCVHESGRKITEIETAITTRNGALLLDGKKSWSLDNIEDLQLFVLSRNGAGPFKGPGTLVCVQMPLKESGITLTGRRTQIPVPELPHAEVTFKGVALSADHVLAGDGYADFAKPFRLREDIFVTGCTLAYLFGEGRLSSWPTTWAQQCIAGISGLYGCSTLDPHLPDTHILTAGVLAMAEEVIRDAEYFWGRSGGDKLTRWHRDQTLLFFGKDARRQRVIKSWQSFGRALPETAGLGDHISGSIVL